MFCTKLKNYNIHYSPSQKSLLHLRRIEHTYKHSVKNIGLQYMNKEIKFSKIEANYKNFKST